MTKDTHLAAKTVPASAPANEPSPTASPDINSALAMTIARAVEALPDLPETTIIFDLETTGLSPAWDQILQFGALRCDTETLQFGNPEDSIVNLRGRLKPEVVPSPAALLTTRVWPHMLTAAPLSHDELMRKVSDVLADAAPAVYVGHNAVRFDSPHLRHNLFSALLPPYTLHTQGSRLVDTLLLAHLLHALAPGAMHWPRKADGKLSFRLADLCAANSISLDPDEAHDALADVTATLELYALMRKRAPDVFALGHALADKHFVSDMALENELLAIIRVSGSGATVTPVATLMAIHEPLSGWPQRNEALRMPGNPNALVALDLRIDPATYLDLDAGELRTLIAGKSSPVKVIRTNAMPLVIPMDPTDPAAPDAIKSVRIDGIDGDAAVVEAELLRRAAEVRTNPAFVERLRLVLRQLEAERPVSMYVEEQLYAGGFATDRDFVECRRFLELQPEKRHLWRDRIRDERLQAHALRLIHATAPDTLEPEQRRLLDGWLRNRLTTTDDVPWMTIPRALSETDSLRQSLLDHADAEACTVLPDPPPAGRCAETGVPLTDHEALEETERNRLDFIEAQVGADIALLDDYAAWLKAKLVAVQTS